MSKLNTGFLLRVFLFTAFVSAMVAGLHSDLFKIQTANIEEAPESESSEVFQNLQPAANMIAHSYFDQNIWWVDVGEIAKKIKTLPGVKDVVVERMPPQTLRIFIIPEAIRLIYVTKRGKMFPITESAQVIRDFNPKLFSDAPITREEKIIKDSNIRTQAVDLVSSLPAEGLFSRNSISELELETKSAEKSPNFWLSLIQSDLKVKINPENASLKAERVERVLDYTLKHNLHARVIDSEYSKKVVVKLRKDR